MRERGSEERGSKVKIDNEGGESEIKINNEGGHTQNHYNTLLNSRALLILDGCTQRVIKSKQKKIVSEHLNTDITVSSADPLQENQGHVRVIFTV